MAKGSIVVLKNNELVVTEVELESGECPVGYQSIKDGLDGAWLEHITLTDD